MHKITFYVVLTVVMFFCANAAIAAEEVVETTTVTTTTKKELPLNYITFRGGPGWANKVNRVAGIYESDQKFKSEYMLNLAYGRYLCDWFRLEGELGYVHMGLDKLENKNTGNEVDISGRDTHITGMLNAYIDIINSTDFTPFVGGGIGFAHAELDTEFIGPFHGAKVRTEDSDTVFAYQLLAGVSWAFHPSWALDLMYKFYGTNERNHTNSEGNATEVDVKGTQASFVELGLRYRF